MIPPMRRWLRRCAAAGAVAWCVVALASPLGTIEKLFLLAPLVAMPLAFALDEPASWMLGLLHPAAAAAATASFFQPPGFLAAALATPWAILTGAAVVDGLLSFRGVTELGARLLLPVGGGALVASRAGFTPLDFGEPLVLLTAVHFHFTAFLAVRLALLAGARTAAIGILAGTPLLAVGFVLSPLLKLAAVGLLVAALFGVARAQILALPRLKGRMSKLLLGLSAASIAAGMLVAGTYELGVFTARGWLSIPDVALVHGPLNGLGFTLGGLMAWTRERS